MPANVVGMRIARERLIFLALSVLVGWSEGAAKGPVQPDISVRLALAMLYACGKSRDRRIYDEFWRLLSDSGSQGMHESQRNYIRRSYTNSCIQGMIRDVGAPMTPEYANALSQAARKSRERRATSQ